MTENEQVAFRLPKALIKRVDAYAARLEAAQPGMKVTRTDAVRVLLVRALDAAEQRRPRIKPRR
jgi:hypothetical protein